ncbi:cathepsin B [Schistosoma bovis]|uniref:Cathepsin B n=1 Tax=Schistosoma bovis TaxID=6184 RepID=A0A430Q4Y5_SCHBO|nr:cathepsin B [Schistosoma bovis]
MMIAVFEEIHSQEFFSYAYVCVVYRFMITLLDAHISIKKERFEPLSDDIISYINQHVVQHCQNCFSFNYDFNFFILQPNAEWKAEKSNRFHSLDDARILMGARREEPELRKKRRPTVDHNDWNVEIPSSFDSRKKWPRCKSIATIHDQSRCGSCWVVDLVGDGGFLGPAWDYWVEEGIVTGSSKENHTGCQPYPFPKCEHHAKGKYPACGKKIYKTPRCKKTCQKSYKIPYAQDKHRGKLSYNVADNELSIQKEIMKYGPVEATFTVYEDFLNYKSGIYKHITGEPVGGHAIRIIGWGVEKNTPYWLIANSWNEDWGENDISEYYVVMMNVASNPR